MPYSPSSDFSRGVSRHGASRHLSSGFRRGKNLFRNIRQRREIGIVERRFALSGASSVCDLPSLSNVPRHLSGKFLSKVNFSNTKKCLSWCFYWDYSKSCFVCVLTVTCIQLASAVGFPSDGQIYLTTRTELVRIPTLEPNKTPSVLLTGSRFFGLGFYHGNSEGYLFMSDNSQRNVLVSRLIKGQLHSKTGS